MALTKSVSINGEDSRVTYGIEVTKVSGRGLGTVRRGSTPLGESPGRVGQQAFLDEKLIRVSGQISSTTRAGLLSNWAKLLRAIGAGRDGRRTFILRFEDTTTPAEFICHYAGDADLGEISNTWFVNYIAEFSFTAAVQSGYGTGGYNAFAHDSIPNKKILYVNNPGDLPVRPLVRIVNTSVSAITALTLRNFAKRRILRTLTGTMSTAFGFGDTAFGGLSADLSLAVSTGTNTYSFANDALWPFERGWTILFRFERIFTTSNRTFWQTSAGNDKLIFDSVSGNLQLILNNAVTATFNSALANLPTASFVQVACRLRPVLATAKTSDVADIFIGTVKGNSVTNVSTQADPGTSLFFGTDNAGGTRAEGFFDDIIIFGRALSDEEIQRLAQSRPLVSLEGVCLYANFSDGSPNGIGMSNLDMTFSGISLATNDSLIVDCERQTAKKINTTLLASPTDQLSLFSGEFMEVEPGDNMLQLLITGGGATNNVRIDWPDRRAA